MSQRISGREEKNGGNKGDKSGSSQGNAAQTGTDADADIVAGKRKSEQERGAQRERKTRSIRSGWQQDMKLAEQVFAEIKAAEASQQPAAEQARRMGRQEQQNGRAGEDGKHGACKRDQADQQILIYGDAEAAKAVG